MKKTLLISLITLLCLAMTVPAFLTAFFAAEQGGIITPSANAGNLGMSALEDSEESKEVSIEDFIIGDPANTFDLGKKTEFKEPNAVDTKLKGAITSTNRYHTFLAMGEDPYAYIKKGSSLPTKTGRFIVITYRSYDAVDCDLQFYIGSSGTGATSNDSMMRQPIELNEEGDKTWRTMLFDTATMPSTVYDGQKCTYFRLDPLEGAATSGKSIDIRKIEFYNSDAIDIDAYTQYLAEEEAKKNRVDWPDPEYVEMETSANDHYAGSLTYTPSEDTTQMTISYKVGDKTVSYTVPNKNNYLFGGYVGTDDVGRELYTSTDIRNEKDGTTIGVIGENGERYVGLFYFLWLGQHKVGNDAIYNLQEIIDNYGENYLEHLGPNQAHHFYAEPLYGYYYSQDKWVMKKHAELLCNAGIDFLYLDATNANPYMPNAMQMMSVLSELNEQGYDAPQVVFYTNSSSNYVIDQLYKAIYEPGLYEDTWFRIDGKPVIVGTENTDSAYGRQWNGDIDQQYKDYFYIKESQWPNEKNQKQDAWPWMDFGWPQKIFTNAEGKLSAISVSVAQHNITVAFGTSAFGALSDPAKWGGAKINRGRSFNARNDAAITREQYHEAWLTDPSMTNLGLNFQAQWDKAHDASEKDQLEFVLVTGWNEWVAQYQEGKDALFVDCASMEFSRDTEMMRGGYFDNYYMQLVQNVEKLKGDAPVIIQDARKPINVTGSFDQWNDVLVTYTDPMQDNLDRNAPGYGGNTYIDTTGRNDIVASKIIADTKNVYFYAKTRFDVSAYDKMSSWMQLFIDADCNAETGWYGYDFIVNYRAKNDFTTTVARYTGNNNAYRFVADADVDFRAKNNEIMIAVPLDVLGMDNYEELHFQFKWADSENKITTMEQFYTEGDAAPLGRLNYVFQNYIPGATEIETETETETDPETDPETEPETDPATEPETETETETETQSETVPATDSETQPSTDEGCASVVSVSAAALILVATAAAVALKKKED